MAYHCVLRLQKNLKHVFLKIFSHFTKFWHNEIIIFARGSKNSPSSLAMTDDMLHYIVLFLCTGRFFAVYRIFTLFFTELDH